MKAKDFKVGMKVKFVKDCDYGKVGDIAFVVDGVKECPDYIHVSSVRGGEALRSGGLFAFRFEVVADEPIIKVGDTVEIIAGGWGTLADKIGTQFVVKATVVDCTPGIDKHIRLDSGRADGLYCRIGGVKRVEPQREALDFAKPLETDEGTPVTLVAANGRDSKYPVLAYEGSSTQVSKFTLTGENSKGVARRNIRNVVPKPVTRTVYANVYKDIDGLYTGPYHDTVKEAQDTSGSGFGTKALGRVKIVLVEGQFAE